MPLGAEMDAALPPGLERRAVSRGLTSVAAIAAGTGVDLP